MPQGFRSRIIARTGQFAAPTKKYRWHARPDGGATYPTADGGWIYVSNSEVVRGGGGVGAIRFDKTANVIDSYSILEKTTYNCAGGHTPWGTWLSCEEFDRGRVWECDPTGKTKAIPRPALGIFKHEAVAVDTNQKILYLTEDQVDGCLYRYRPLKKNMASRYDLERGSLEVLTQDKEKKTKWKLLPDPLSKTKATRHQVSDAIKFNGGEGIWYVNEMIYFATKGDDTIWAYHTLREDLKILYRASTHPNPILTGVDNLTATRDGDLLVAEDGGDLEIVALTKTGKIFPILQLAGHDKSEVAGPSFDPSGTRLYFSSQKGAKGNNQSGITFEIEGPFYSSYS